VRTIDDYSMRLKNESTVSLKYRVRGKTQVRDRVWGGGIGDRARIEVRTATGMVQIICVLTSKEAL
jgi:hypothetical protein